MAQVKSSLVLADLILLRVIAQNPCVTKRELWGVRCAGLWNKALKPLVEAGKLSYVTSDHRYGSSIATLRWCGLLMQTPPYEITRDAEKLLSALPKRVKQWPLCVGLYPDGSRAWDTAQYDYGQSVKEVVKE